MPNLWADYKTISNRSLRAENGEKIFLLERRGATMGFRGMPSDKQTVVRTIGVACHLSIMQISLFLHTCCLQAASVFMVGVTFN